MKQQKNKFTNQEVIDAYNKEKHLGKLAVLFEVPHIQMWRVCKKLGLDFGNGGGAKVKIPLDEILAGRHPYYQTLKLKKRLIREGIFENKCSCCDLTDWQGKEIVLQLDHISGDSSDHRKENLRLLCPNCHSQTDTWCGKNIGDLVP